MLEGKLFSNNKNLELTAVSCNFLLADFASVSKMLGDTWHTVPEKEKIVSISNIIFFLLWSMVSGLLLVIIPCICFSDDQV